MKYHELIKYVNIFINHKYIPLDKIKHKQSLTDNILSHLILTSIQTFCILKWLSSVLEGFGIIVIGIRDIYISFWKLSLMMNQIFFNRMKSLINITIPINKNAETIPKPMFINNYSSGSTLYFEFLLVTKVYIRPKMKPTRTIVNSTNNKAKVILLF